MEAIGTYEWMVMFDLIGLPRKDTNDNENKILNTEDDEKLKNKVRWKLMFDWLISTKRISLNQVKSIKTKTKNTPTFDETIEAG